MRQDRQWKIAAVVSYLRNTFGERRWPILALRAGILFGVAVGAFAGLYTGMLGLYWQRVRLGRTGHGERNPSGRRPRADSRSGLAFAEGT